MSNGTTLQELMDAEQRATLASRRTAMDLMSADKLASIASCGMGFEMQVAGRTITELLTVARAACKGSARVVMLGLTSWPIEDLREIGLAGQGHVSAR